MEQYGYTDPVLELGAQTQKDLSGLSQMMINTINTEKPDEIIALLNQTILFMKQSAKEDKKKVPFWRAKKYELDTQDRYREMEKRVDQLEEEIKKRQVALVMNKTMYEQIDAMNRTYQDQLIEGIEKIRQELDELKRNPKHQMTFLASNDITTSRTEYQARLVKRLQDLEVTRMVAKQLSAQIHVILTNNRRIFEKTQDVMQNTIVLWRNQVVLLLQKGRAKADALLEMEKQNDTLMEQFTEMVQMEEEQKKNQIGTD